MFSLGMGTFAFMGREALVRRTATKNYLLASPVFNPFLTLWLILHILSKICVSMLCKFLSPIIIGMTLGKGLEEFTSITTPSGIF
ncbi:MAG: hypothetical protein CM15mP8_4110 [Methanobacteriota archaeon]|nr:MAG: hypothetical protein CM15mP8_4110 [Euryarchaeota archaeon]